MPEWTIAAGFTIPAIALSAIARGHEAWEEKADAVPASDLAAVDAAEPRAHGT
jgi:hypothetical protein